jgi:hypothetical protein
VGIDFGAVFLMAFLAKYDLDQQRELQGKVDEKLEKKKEMVQLSRGMREREKLLGSLRLEITVSADGGTRVATVADLQNGAKQHMVVVAGPRRACKDALIGANLLKLDFAMSNVLVVAYEIDEDATRVSRPSSGGFGDRPSYEAQPYVARATDDAWEDYIRLEMEDAIKQNGDRAKKEGIAIVVANNGRVIRRGIGTVPWREVVQQLEESVNPNKETPLSWL